MQTLPLEVFKKRFIVKPEDDILGQVMGQLPLTVDKVWLAGGAIRRTILGQSLLEADFDLFFSDKQSYNDALKVTNGVELFSTQNHTTFQVEVKINNAPQMIKLQLIKIQFYKSVEELLQSFDFTICQFACDGQSMYSGDFSMMDTVTRKLVVNKIKYPVSSMKRVIKYAKQGFYACNGCLSTFLNESHSIMTNESQNMQVQSFD